MIRVLVATVRCLSTEELKLRRTLAPVLAVVLPSVAAALEALLTTHGDSTVSIAGVDRVGWFLYGAFNLWCAMLLPLFVALECSLVAGVEHQSHGFRRLLSLPIPRSSVYLSKLTTNLVLLASAFGILLASTFVALRIAARARPDLGLDGEFPWGGALRLTALTFVASLFLLAVHSFIALRWSSHALGVSVSIVGILGTVSLSEMPIRWVYPWAMPTLVQGVVSGLAFGWGSAQSMRHVERALVHGGVGAALVLLVGGFLLVRRDVV